jgi:hypothetical protein
MNEYREKKRNEPPTSRCGVCGIESITVDMDPHHPGGRLGANLLIYFRVHRGCHELIHRDERLAKEKGWMN